MVKPTRPRISSKPIVNPTPSADSWVNSGGIDPEIQTTPTAPEPEDQKKKFPHRISFDMTSEQYKRLKLASFQTDRPMNEILRDAVEAYLLQKQVSK